MANPTQPRQRSIPFSPLMVQAIRDRRKTQTRREIKPQPIIDPDSGLVFDGKHRKSYKNDVLHRPWQAQFILDWCSYQIGDVLLVGEPWRTNVEYNHLKPSELPDDALIYYEGTIPSPGVAFGRYRNARFLPFRFRRLKLEVVGIKIERLQDITEEDAIAEGVNVVEIYNGCPHYENYMDETGFEFQATDSFCSLWDFIHGEFACLSNRWLFAYTFKLL